MQEVVKLKLTILKLHTLTSAREAVGITFFSLLLVPEREQITIDQLQVSDEAVRSINSQTV